MRRVAHPTDRDAVFVGALGHERRRLSAHYLPESVVALEVDRRAVVAGHRRLRRRVEDALLDLPSVQRNPKRPV